MVTTLKPRYGLDDIDTSKIPEELKSLPYWNIWRLERRKGTDRITKTPLSIHTGYFRDVQDAEHLGTIEQALEAARRFGAHGIGFSFIEGCGLVGLDFDDCITDGALHSSVADLVHHLGYCEISPSGTGIKVWAKADAHFTGRNRVSNFPADGIETECYSWGRYFTVTSQRHDALSNGLVDQTPRIETIRRMVKAEAEAQQQEKRQTKQPKKPTPKRQPKSETQSTAADLSDRDLWDAAFRNQRNGSEIEALYRGDWQGYESQSQADLVLCNHLAFYTGNDDSRMDRMFRESGLFRPEKWDRYIPSWGRTYGENTIAEAVAITANHYEPRNADSESGDKNAQAADVAGEWGEVVPLQVYPEVPWPDKPLLPPVIERHTDAVALETQTDPAVAKLNSIPILGACSQDRYVVSPLPTWTNEPLSIYSCIGLNTGDRKTSVEKRQIQPILDFEELALDRWKTDAIESKTEREMLEAQEAKLLRDAGKAKPGDDVMLKENLIECRRLMADLETLYPRTILADDATPEALYIAMWEQGGPLAILDAEGGVFRAMAGGYGKQANLDTIYLKGYSNEKKGQRRVSRGAISIPVPALTIGIMTQPGHLREELQRPIYQGRGLLERFLWALPESKVGYRDVTPPQMPDWVAQEYHDLITRLLPSTEPANTKTRDRKILTFSPAAQKVLVNFMEWLEPQLREDGDLFHIVGWGNRLPGNVVRIASLWHLAEVEGSLEVEADKVERAVILAREYLLPQALKTFGLLEFDPRINVALSIIRKIREIGWLEFQRSDLTRAIRSIKADELRNGLKLLTEYGYLRASRRETPGRNADLFEVHPGIFEDEHFEREETSPVQSSLSIKPPVRDDRPTENDVLQSEDIKF